MQFDIRQFQTVNFPESLVSISDFHVLQFQIFHFAEELRPVNHRVFHRHIAAVPDSRATLRGKITVGDEALVNMPPRVFAIEFRTFTFYILTAFDARLAIGDRDILQAHVFQSKERTLASKLFILNDFHFFLTYFDLIFDVVK